MTILRPASQGASRMAGATQVVLPLPGGAVRTTLRFAARAAAISPIFSSTGNAIAARQDQNLNMICQRRNHAGREVS